MSCKCKFGSNKQYVSCCYHQEQRKQLRYPKGYEDSEIDLTMAFGTAIEQFFRENPELLGVSNRPKDPEIINRPNSPEDIEMDDIPTDDNEPEQIDNPLELTEPEEIDKPLEPTPTPVPNSEPSTEENELYEQLKREIGAITREDAIKLIDENEIFLKIDNSGLTSRLKNDLHRIRREKLAQLRIEHYNRYFNLIDGTNSIIELNALHTSIADDKVLSLQQIPPLLKRINDKISEIRQREEYDRIRQGILGENDVVKVDVDWRDEIISAKYLSDTQRSELERIRNEQKWNLRGMQKYQQFKAELERALIGDLVDEKMYDTLIENDTFLSDSQKEELQRLRKEQLSKLTDKTFNDLKNSLRNERVLSRLQDGGITMSVLLRYEKNFYLRI